MRIDILTLFPGMFQGPLSESIMQRAQDQGALDLQIHDLREYGVGNYRQVDDEPYGGGAGMVLKVDVLAAAIDAIKEKGEGDPHVILFAPRGDRLDQECVEGLSTRDWLILVCAHYEGVDQRIVEGGWIDQELSIGNYVLTGGELPAAVLTDAVVRLIPGVLGDDHSAQEESFSDALDRKREYPHYTRPEEYQGLRVPDVLRSGHHKEIEEWRRGQLS